MLVATGSRGEPAQSERTYAGLVGRHRVVFLTIFCAFSIAYVALPLLVNNLSGWQAFLNFLLVMTIGFNLGNGRYAVSVAPPMVIIRRLFRAENLDISTLQIRLSTWGGGSFTSEGRTIPLSLPAGEMMNLTRHLRSLYPEIQIVDPGRRLDRPDRKSE